MTTSGMAEVGSQGHMYWGMQAQNRDGAVLTLGGFKMRLSGFGHVSFLLWAGFPGSKDPLPHIYTLDFPLRVRW